MRSGIRGRWDNLSIKLESCYRKYEYRRKGRIRLRRMNGGYKCTKEYKEIVIPYWKKYGLKPKKMWYQIFWDRSHEADPRYIPDDLYYGEIVPYFSNTQFRRFGEDKCLYDAWFKDLNRPRTIIMNIAGVYYTPDLDPITEGQAIELCMSETDFLIKPSIDSGEGRLIHFFEKGDFSDITIKDAFSALGANFIAQDIVRQHPVLKSFNESSLNTIRIVSFFFKNEVHILSAILRIGAKGSRVDNVGAGGYACVIKSNGELEEKGVNRKAEWCSETANGITFRGTKIPAYDEIIHIVKETHSKLSHFKLIGWDFGIDEEGKPIFVEYNVCPGSNQITAGPTFGDLTEEVLDEVYIKKTLKNAQN